MRRALFVALLLATSCKKTPPQGDLPPVGESKPAEPAAAAPPATNPHGSMTSAGTSPHAGTVPGKTDARTLEKLADGRYALGPFSLALPDKWTQKPVTSSMRAADLILPGGDAELIVYYFGEGGAGSIDDNLDRWLNQFQQADGKKSRDVAKIDKTKFADQDATYVSVAGRFVADAMPGAGSAVDKTNQALLAAIVNSPSGPYYFKLVGNKPTVDANAQAFRSMLGSMKLQ